MLFPRRASTRTTPDSSSASARDFELAMEWVRNTRLEPLASFLARKPSVGRMSAHDGETLLMRAASGDSMDLMRLLLPLSDVAAADSFGETALSRAAWSGQPESIQILLEHGAPADAATARGLDPLMVAASAEWRGALDCARLLLPRSDLGRVDHEGRSALFIALMNREAPACFSQMIWEAMPEALQKIQGDDLFALAVSHRPDIDLLDALSPFANPQRVRQFCADHARDPRTFMPRFFVAEEARALASAAGLSEPGPTEADSSADLGPKSQTGRAARL